MPLDQKSYQEKVICFLDILGISDFTKNNTEEELYEIYKIIDNLITNDIRLPILNLRYISENLIISSLSDSIVISFPTSEIPLLLPIVSRMIGIIQLLFIQKGLCIRGFVTTGKINHSKDTKIIFGEGLVKAYEYEKTNIFSPRVVIENKLISDFKVYNINKFEGLFNRLISDGYVNEDELQKIVDGDIKKAYSSNPELIMAIFNDHLNSCTTLDTYHNDIYKNLPDKLDNNNSPKIIVDSRKDLSHLNQFRKSELQGIVHSKIKEFKNKDNEVSLKWEYLEKWLPGPDSNQRPSG